MSVCVHVRHEPRVILMQQHGMRHPRPSIPPLFVPLRKLALRCQLDMSCVTAKCKNEDEMKTTNLCPCEGLGKDVFLSNLWQYNYFPFVFMGFVQEVKSSALLIPDNWAEISIKSQFEQLTVSPWYSEQSWICARGHEQGGSMCSVCIWRSERQPWSQVLSISQCNSLPLWHRRSKMEQWIKLSSLFDTPDSQWDDCIIPVHSVSM